MNRLEFQKLSNLRRKEALTLLKAKQYEGAYYLVGFAVECALKACIAKQTNKHDFPPPQSRVQKVYIHDLKELMKQAGLEVILEKEMKINKTLESNWAEVVPWTVEARYKASLSGPWVKSFYAACTARKNGLLNWIKRRW